MNVNSSSNRGEAILAALKTQFPGAVLDVGNSGTGFYFITTLAAMLSGKRLNRSPLR